MNIKIALLTISLLGPSISLCMQKLPEEEQKQLQGYMTTQKFDNDMRSLYADSSWHWANSSCINTFENHQALLSEIALNRGQDQGLPTLLKMTTLSNPTGPKPPVFADAKLKEVSKLIAKKLNQNSGKNQ